MEGWLASTVELQEQAFGIRLPLTGEALADYVTWNVTALVAEVGEALEHLQWKVWAKDRGALDRSSMRDELIDVEFFLANLFAALGVSDKEHDQAYARKRQVNIDRQASGQYAG